MSRLAIVCTHPIQYHSPVFEQLAARQEIEVKVFYGWRGATSNSYDPGFAQPVQWDIPLLRGYDYEFVENTSSDPGSHHFRGIQLPSLNTRIADWNAEAILVYGWCYQAHLQAMRHFKRKIPILFRGDSTMLSDPVGPKRWIRRGLLRWVYRSVDVALYVGTRNREYFLSHGLHPRQLVFAPHSIDNDRFAQADNGGTQYRDALGIGPDEVVILFPGKLESIKQPKLLLSAFERLNGDGHLVFAGSGSLEQQLRRRATANVHFIGFKNQSEMPGVYAMSDLVVLPSRGETWGLVLNEAMACSRAVLASDRVGAAVDLIQYGKNGWIFEQGKASDLADCLRRAVDCGRDSLREMGETSKSIIEEWSIPRQVQGIERAVFGLISGVDPPNSVRGPEHVGGFQQ